MKKTVAEEVVNAMAPFHEWFTKGDGAVLLEEMRRLMGGSARPG